MSVDFELIYRTDLVYVPDCWRLCGDAHCCSFERYKARFRLIGTPPVQQLPLLPGEYAWLRARGLLERFRAHELRSETHEFAGRRIRFETLVGSERGCVCAHATRTTVCRLYPLLPCFDAAGRLAGVDTEFGSFEMLENLQGLERVCRITQIPFAELDKLAQICAAIAQDPLALFHVEAYRLTKAHVRARLPQLAAARDDDDMFAAFEMSLVRRGLIDRTTLDAELAALASRFEAQHGAPFAARLAATTSP